MSSLLRRAWWLACLVGRSPTPEARKWNVVVISLNALRADHLGAWGETRPTSPRLDRLCAESVVFRDAISQAGVTAPSHMSLFTSLYPSEHGVRTSHEASKRATEATAARLGAGGGVELDGSEAEALRALGYTR
ncbi:MAG: sulfatase-like hydrolase/transferase [Planctomycetes bacterium]|nr:sulfatase-like hydrolase/transferase [Planctomycetota bacterium]